MIPSLLQQAPHPSVLKRAGERDCNRWIAMDEERVIRGVRRWESRLESPPPQWWEWAVAAAQYHLADCDWVVIGVGKDHCSCSLTRVIAKIIDEAKR